MSHVPQKSDASKNTPPASATVLLSDIADTSWRMFVPTIGLTVLGLILDKALHTTPWVMIVGIVLGAGFAALLVRAQFRKVRK